jgi:predicted nucleotidyltransferase
MGRALAETAQRLQCSERTLRRCVNDGMLQGEQLGRGELRLPRSEELYLLRHWELLSKLRRALRTEPGVKLAVLFGSVAVGEDRPDSDVDVLIDHTTGDPTEVVRLQRRLGGQVGKPIHLVLREDVRQVPVLLADILQEGRVIVDRGDRWPRLLRSRPRILREAKEEEAAIRAAAWRGIDEARQRLEAS